MRVDAHHHLWRLATGVYDWITPDLEPLHRDYSVEDYEPLARSRGMTRSVLVQAADAVADTEAMLVAAGRSLVIGAVIGWVPLDDPSAASDLLDRYASHAAWRGVRPLISRYADDRWLLRTDVGRSLSLLEDRGLVLDLAAAPRHLPLVPELVRRHPGLRLVIDHLAYPPLGAPGLDRWADDLRSAAEASPQVVAKLSGLGSAVGGPAWSAEDVRSAVDIALDAFGPTRLMAGSDWPVSLLHGSWDRTWDALEELVARMGSIERDAVLGDTAARVYVLEAGAERVPGGAEGAPA